MNKKIIIAGIDVGLSAGCLAVALTKDGIVISKIKTFKPIQWVDVLQKLKKKKYCTVVYVEKLWGRPGMNAKSINGMMKEYGRTIGILQALEIEYIEVVPMIWQKVIGHIAPKGSDYNLRKELLVERAKKDYPKRKLPKWEADGLLIMQYGLLKEKERNNK